jgi:hypothetical protein
MHINYLLSIYYQILSALWHANCFFIISEINEKMKSKHTGGCYETDTMETGGGRKPVG